MAATKSKKKEPKQEIAPEVQAQETLEATENSENIKNSQDNPDSSSEPSADNTYRVFKDMTLDEIQELLNIASEKLTTEDLIYVNLAEAETVSTAIVQAIISLNRYAGHNQKVIKWQNPTTGFSDAFNNLGFYSEMMRLEFA